jgi:glycine dehydrogenase
MITELTGLPVSNASLLDESTSAAEAMFMSYNIHNNKRNKYFMSKHIFPQTIDVVKTRAYGLGIELVIDEPANFNWDKVDEYCGYMVQNPDNLGNVSDISEVTARLKQKKVVVTVVADILSLAIIKPPGEMGADIAVGSAQRFGVPMAYGGPHAGYMACKDDFKRKMPGRLIGVSKDVHGDKAFRMALQTREQHIRRDKATSNICTAQALLANISSFFGQWHGAEGLKKIAKRVRFYADILIQEL